MEWTFAWISRYGYGALFALLMLGIIGAPVPDETLLTFSGYLVFKGELAAAPTLVTAFLGSISGITVSYTIGRGLGRWLLSREGGWWHVDRGGLDRVLGWYQRWGKYALLFGYFLPGVRHVTALVAGSSRLPVKTFAAFAYLGALAWSSSFVALGYLLGEEWARTSAGIRHVLVAIGAIGFAVLGGWTWLRRSRRVGGRPGG